MTNVGMVNAQRPKNAGAIVQTTKWEVELAHRSKKNGPMMS